MPRTQPKTSAAKAPGSSHPTPGDRAARAALFDERFGAPDRRPLRMVDQMGMVCDAQQAYEALELLITPIMATDCEKLELSRSELGCLLRTINRAMRDELHKANELAQQVHRASLAAA